MSDPLRQLLHVLFANVDVDLVVMTLDDPGFVVWLLQ